MHNAIHLFVQHQLLQKNLKRKPVGFLQSSCSSQCHMQFGRHGDDWDKTGIIIIIIVVVVVVYSGFLSIMVFTITRLGPSQELAGSSTRDNIRVSMSSLCHPHHLHVVTMSSSLSPCHPRCHHVILVVPMSSLLSPCSPYHPYIIPKSSVSSPCHPYIAIDVVPLLSLGCPHHPHLARFHKTS